MLETEMTGAIPDLAPSDTVGPAIENGSSGWVRTNDLFHATRLPLVFYRIYFELRFT